MREASIERKTGETDISLTLRLDGAGNYDISTGCGFLEHMLELFSRHGGFDLKISCVGDSHVDYHHITEDVAIVLGRAFDQILGDRRGINRYGEAVIPMDEALILCAVDISGRPYLGYDLEFRTEKVGEFDVELAREFMAALCRSLGATIHLRMLSGENSHHIIEGAFKALARALRAAVSLLPDGDGRVPSTKGTII